MNQSQKVQKPTIDHESSTHRVVNISSRKVWLHKFSSTLDEKAYG